MKAHPGQNCDEYMLEKTKGAITNEQSRVTSNIGYTRHNTKTNKANTKTKIRHGSKDEPNIVFMWKS